MRCQSIKIINKKKAFICEKCTSKSIKINFLTEKTTEPIFELTPLVMFNKSEDESDFDDNKENEDPNKKDKEKGKKKAIKVNLILMNLVIIFIMSSLICRAESKVIMGDFKYCIINTSSPTIDTEHDCNNNINEHQSRTNEEFSMLEKREYAISGFGYHCQRTKTIVTTWKTFFGTEMSSTETEHFETSIEDCYGLMISKNCGEEKMTCDLHANHCYFKGQPVILHQHQYSHPS